MAQFKLEAISLRYVNVRDNDRYVTLLTADQGLIDVYARRARRPKSPLMARTEPFVSGTWLGYARGETYYLDQVDIRYLFPKLNQDVTTLTSATQLADLMREAAGDPALNGDLYQLLHHALYALERKPADYKRVVAATGIYTLQLLGLAPDPHVCGVCGEPLDIRSKLRFYHMAGYFVCERHPYAVDPFTQQAIYESVPASVPQTLAFMEDKEPRNYLSFTLGSSDEDALWDFSRTQLMFRLERDWKNLKLLDELQSQHADMDELLSRIRTARETKPQDPDPPEAEPSASADP